MATTTSTVSTAVRQRATDLLEDARKFCNNDNKIDEAYVDIEVLKGTQKVLNDLCGKVISDNSTRTSIEGILKKAQNKLQRAEQLNTFLRSNNITGIDPRVERIMKKIADQKLTSYSPSAKTAIHEKLTKWDAILRTCSRFSNEPTKQTAASGRSSISEIDMELLQHAPHIVTFNHSLRSGSNDHFYKPYSITGNALPNREECIKLASAFYAKRYLSFASSGLDNHRFDNDGPRRDIDEHAHRSTAEHLKIFRCSDGISVEHLFPGSAPEYLNAVSFPASFSCKEISFPSNANVDEVQKQIDNLIALKISYRLNWISSFIEIKPQMLAIVLHPSGRISLVNPCGSKTNPNSYEANFANSKQAAEFLKNLIGEMGTNNRIVFKPYSKAGAIPKTEESTSNSSSSSSVLDLALDPDPVWYHTPSPSSSSSSSSSSTLLRVKPKIDEDFIILQEATLIVKEGILLPERLSEALSKRTGVLSTNIFDRMCFHLYHIQDKETPNIVNRQDHNWGFTAFTDEKLATPQQRMRAAQRVQVEMLLQHLEKELSGDEISDLGRFQGLREALEGLQLNPSDLPSGQTNAAHALHAKFQQAYVKAREGHPSWWDPNCEYDFARRAFCAQFAHAEFSFQPMRLEAVRALVQELKTTWRI